MDHDDDGIGTHSNGPAGKKYFTWLLVFLFLFLEDVFRIHQSLGLFFYNVFGMTTGQRGGKIMELLQLLF